MHALGGRHRGGEGRERPPAPAPAGAAGQVELHVGTAGRGEQRLDGGSGQRGAAEVGVQQHPGCVDDGGQGGGAGRQRGDRGVGHAVRGDRPGAGLILRTGDRGLHQSPAELPLRFGQPGVGEQDVGARDKTPGVHGRDLTRRHDTGFNGMPRRFCYRTRHY